MEHSFVRGAKKAGKQENSSAPMCCRQYVLLGQNPSQSKDEHGVIVADCHRCRLSIAFNFIDQVTPEKVTEEAVANVLGVSASRLRHIWTRYLGIGFRQYMIRMRLERARRLIRVEGLSVHAAAAELGIHDISHLYRDLKRHLHITHAELQEQALEAAAPPVTPRRQ